MRLIDTNSTSTTLNPNLVEVVRCKECKYYMGVRCYRWRGFNDLRSKEDFCSYGERK